MNLAGNVLDPLGLGERHRHVGAALPGIPALQRHRSIRDEEHEPVPLERVLSVEPMGGAHGAEFPIRSRANACFEEAGFPHLLVPIRYSTFPPGPESWKEVITKCVKF